MDGNLITLLPDVEFDESLYQPISIGNADIDKFISNSGGIMPSTITMVSGDAGAGKTTLMCKWIADAAKNSGARVAFISSEMDQIDFGEYFFRFREFGNIPIYFVDFDRNIKADVEEFLSYGWDIVLIDSVKDLQDKIADQENCTKSSAELWLMQTILKYKKGYVVNDKTYHTAFLLIQQVLKSGNFAGSNSIKHQVTASLQLKVADGSSYMVYDKNRRGITGRTIHYEIKANGIEYDMARLKLDDDVSDLVEKSSENVSMKTTSDSNQLMKILRDRNQHARPLVDITELVNSVENPDSGFDTEKIRRIMSEQNGNLTAALRILKEMGDVPEDYSGYMFKKYCESHDIDRRTYGSSND